MASRGCFFRVVLAIAVALTAAGLLIAFLLAPAPNERPDVGTAIEGAVAALAEGKSLRVADFTDFDWDFLVVYPPYAPNTVAKEALGFDWPAERLPTYGNDAWTAMLFVADGDVTGWCLIRQSVADFPALQQGAIKVSRAEAILSSNRGASGTVQLPFTAERASP